MDGENWYNYAFTVGTSTIFLYFSFFLGSPGEHAIKSGDSPCKKGSSDCSVKGASDEHTSQEDEKKIPRNKACPCGSKKKYKSCCGSVAGKHPTSYTVYGCQ
ncbi:hypothetical protein H5410_014474 [Solanum commersonii]|uniref:Uncharacterized protein n=1 Tax=Solanum commersonii TaxID=4109 RepID=A0A9J5ZRH3_SOLCO|nr:hypothetical protein H5410_014474 [Solanum commersonii]